MWSRRPRIGSGSDIGLTIIPQYTWILSMVTQPAGHKIVSNYYCVSASLQTGILSSDLLQYHYA